MLKEIKGSVEGKKMVYVISFISFISFHLLIYFVYDAAIYLE